MKRALLLCAFMALPARAEHGPEPYVLTLGASMSRGAHQAGLTYAVLRWLRANHDETGVALGGVSGVSAGGLNSLLAALTWCLADDEAIAGRFGNRPDDNLLWQTWSEMDWVALFPGDLDCRDYRARFPHLDVDCEGDSPYGATDGVITLNGIADVRDEVLRLFSRADVFRAQCRVPLALALAADEPAEQFIGAYQIPTLRRHLSLELRTQPVADGRDGRHTMRVCAIDPPPQRRTSAPTVTLPQSAAFNLAGAEAALAVLERIEHRARRAALRIRTAGDPAAALFAPSLAAHTRRAAEVAGRIYRDAGGWPALRERAAAAARGLFAEVRALSVAGAEVRGLSGPCLDAEDPAGADRACRAAMAAWPRPDCDAPSEETPRDLCATGRALADRVTELSAPRHRTCREVDPVLMLDALAAGAAPPPLLPPQPLLHCGTDCDMVRAEGAVCPPGTHLCRDHFTDGGLFDPIPLAGALAIAPTGLGEPETPTQVRTATFLLLEPSAEPPPMAISDHPFRPQGYTFYRRFFGDFLRVATQYELQTLLRYDVLPEGPGALRRIPEPDPILGDFVFGLGAFVDRALRHFDYYRGFVTGMRWVAEHTCQRADALDRCIFERMLGPLHETMGVRSSPRLAYVLYRTMSERWCAEDAPRFERCAEVERRLAEVADYQRTGPVQALWEGTAEYARESSRREAVFDTDAFARVLETARRHPGGQPFDDKPQYEDFRAWWFEQVRMGLERMEAIERQDDVLGVTPVLVGVQFLAATEAADAARGWLLTPSTVPRRVSGSRTASVLTQLLLPYTFSGDLTGGLHVAWEYAPYVFGPPEARFSRFRFVPLGVAAHWTRRSGADEVRVGPQAALWWAPDTFVWPQLATRATLWLGEDRQGQTARVGLEGVARTLGGYLELSVGVFDVTDDRDPELFINVGLADFSGLAYWLVRALSGG